MSCFSKRYKLAFCDCKINLELKIESRIGIKARVLSFKLVGKSFAPIVAWKIGGVDQRRHRQPATPRSYANSMQETLVLVELFASVEFVVKKGSSVYIKAAGRRRSLVLNQHTSWTKDDTRILLNPSTFYFDSTL